MAKKKNLGSKIYAIAISLYVLVLAVLIYMGLGRVWDYAIEYENAVPTKVMDEYVAHLSENLWDDGIAETISNMPHEVQTDAECGEIVKEMLKNDITYVRVAKESRDDESIKYRLHCGDNKFGEVTLVEDESKADEIEFGMLPWKVYKEEFDFNGLYSSVEVVIPSTYSVKLNDIKLGEEYIVESGIHYDVLEEYYARFPALPTKVRYKFDNVFGKLDPVIYDENGEIAAIDPEQDDSQFLVPVTEEQVQHLEEFTMHFVERYKTYISGQYAPDYGYSRLLPFVKAGSELDESMKLAQDGISWAHKHPAKLDINSIVLNNAIYAGDGVYFLDVTIDSTTYKGNEEDNRQENMRIIVTEEANEIRAVALDLY